MSKTAVVDALVQQGAVRAEADRQVDAVFNAVKASLTGNGDKVSIRGFGTFTRKLRPERTGRNPRTGEQVKIAEKSVITFKAAK